MDAKQTILIVEDEVKISDVVKAYLERAGFNALSAATGIEAQKILIHHDISLLVLDLMLPDIPGEEICRRVRGGEYEGINPTLPVIMLTAKADEASLIRGLNMGADDYIKKPFSPRELTARIGAVLRRASAKEAGKEAGTVRIKDIVIEMEYRTVKRGNELINLTFNEYNIFALLASNPLRIFSRDEIIEKAAGENFEGFDRAIDSHIKNLRQKLGDNSRRPKYIETVYGMGYRCLRD